MGSKKFFTLLGIYLVLSLIIIIPMQVSAFSVKISGEQGISGYRESFDSTIINASAQSTVSIEKEGISYPMTCADRNGIYYCSHSFERANLPGGEYVLSFKQEFGDPKSLSWPFIVDEDAPLTKTFEVEDLGNGKLGLSYKIQDSAFFSDPSVCSGIDTISISSDEVIVYEEKISETSVCELEKNNFSIDVEGVSGNVEFYITVSDKLGQSSSASSNNIIVDYKEPELADDLVFKLEGEIIEFVSPNPTIIPFVDVQFSVIEENLLSVKADLRSLSRDPSEANKLKEVVFKCSSMGLKSVCRAEQIAFNPGTGNINIPVTIKDNSGNEVVKTSSTSLQLINKQGEITYFNPSPEHCDDGICYIKNGVAEFLIRVVGADAGIHPQFITLATSELSSITTTKASYCNETDPNTPITDCYSYPVVNIGSDTASKRIVLTSPTSDIMGTQLKGITSTVVSVDNIAPTLKSNLNYSIPGCSIAGETGTISIKMSDDVSTKLFISAETELITGQNYFENECSKEGSNFLCELKITDFVSYPEKENVDIEIRDLAGNIYSENYTFEVCEANNDYPPNFISNLEAESSMKIDRRVASIMPVKTYLNLDITNTKNAEIIDIEFVSCQDYLGSTPYFLNTNSDEVLFVVPIGGSSNEALPSTIPLNCTINFYQKRGDVRFVQPETEQLLVDIGTYNLALGSPDKAAKDKIISAAEELQKTDLKIRKHMKWMQFLIWLCELDDKFTKINQVVSTIKSIVYATSLVFNTFGGGGEQLWDATCPVFHNINKFISKLLPTNLVVSGAEGILGKAKNKVNDFTNDNTVDAGGVKDVLSSEDLKLKLGYFFKAGCMFVHCSQCSPAGISQMANMINLGVNSKASPTEDKLNAEEKKKRLKENSENIDLYKEAKKIEKDRNMEAAVNFMSKDKEFNDVMDAFNSYYDLYIEEHYEDYKTVDNSPPSIVGEPSPGEGRVKLEDFNFELAVAENNYNRKQDIFIEKYTDINKKLTSLRQDQFSLRLGTSHLADERDQLVTEMAKADATAGGFIFSPFNNIHDSKSCVCITGNIYNTNKLKQLQCKKITCMLNSVENGYPSITECEMQFSNEECLYYSGTREKRGGGFKDWFIRITRMNINSYLARPVNTAFEILCGGLFGVGDRGPVAEKLAEKLGVKFKIPDFGKTGGSLGKNTGIKECESQATGWIDVTCGIRLAYIQTKDLVNTFKNGFFESGSHELSPETDFCEGLDVTLGLLANEESQLPGIGEPGIAKLIKNVNKNTEYPDPEEVLWSK